MSADNSILVLVSRDANGRHEYRVAHVQNVEMADYSAKKDRDEYLDCYFKGAVVYRDWGQAHQKAHALEAEIGYVEYGVVEVDIGERFPGSAGKSPSSKGKRAKARRLRRSASLRDVLRLKRQTRDLVRRVIAIETERRS